jgi:tetratricopeptide (TPR) repeat protein
MIKPGFVITIAIILLNAGIPGSVEFGQPATEQPPWDQLEARPRREKFDEVYRFLADRGREAEIEQRYRPRVEAGDGAPALILGLYEQRRGRDEESLVLLAKAEKLRPGDPLPAWLLSQTLTKLGRREEAVVVGERALLRRPDRRDLVLLTSEVARLYRRLEKPEKAREIWLRLEKQLPDRNTREKIARILVDDGQFSDALVRYEALAREETSAARRIAFRLQVADLRVKTANRKDALADYEGILLDLESSDFRARDVRRKLEDLFFKNEDRAGLEVYYREWIGKHPDDAGAIERLTALLADRGNDAEAMKLFQMSLDRNPKNLALRKSYIDLLEHGSNHRAAITQCEMYDKMAGLDQDNLLRWGRFLLRDGNRREEALAVWRRLLPTKSGAAEAAAILRVADLFRQVGSSEEALALYRQAVEAAPNDPSPRENLGEYLHSLKRFDEAVAVWRGLAEGSLRSAPNLMHLSDLLADFNRNEESLQAARDAIALKPEDILLRFRLVDKLLNMSKSLEALNAAQDAISRALTPEERARALDLHIKSLKSMNKLEQEIDSARASLGMGGSAEKWYRYSRLTEAAGRFQEAIPAIEKACQDEEELVAKSLILPALKSLARLYEASGEVGKAAEVTRKLVVRDSRNRSEHLRRLARIEQQRNRAEAALSAARELIAENPDDPERHRFLAETAFELGQPETALKALHEAARVAPNDSSTLSALASILADHRMPAESFDMAWRAFDSAPLEAKPAQARKLAELALRLNLFDQLPAELDRRLAGQESPEAARVAALCQAHTQAVAGDFGAARRCLERLLPERPDDVDLLTYIVELAEKEGDLPSAVSYQRKLFARNGDLAEKRLLVLLMKTGELEEVFTLWARKARNASNTISQLEFLDNLLLFGRNRDVFEFAGLSLRERPRDWELLYRRGVAAAKLADFSRAQEAFQTLLGLKEEDDTTSALLAPTEKKEDPDAIAKQRVEMVSKIRVAIGFDAPQQNQNEQTLAPELWTPADYGQARMAALGWLSSIAERTRTSENFLNQLRNTRGKSDSPDLRGWWDWWYLSNVLSDGQEINRADDVLQRTGLTFFASRRMFNYLSENPKTPRELEQVLADYRTVLRKRPDWVDAQYFAIPSRCLKEFDREKEIDRLYAETMAVGPISPTVVLNQVKIAASRDDVASLLRLLPLLDVSPKGWDEISPTPTPAGLAKASLLIDVAWTMSRLIRQDKYSDFLNLYGGLMDVNLRHFRMARKQPRFAHTIDPVVVGQVNLVFDDFIGMENLPYPRTTPVLERSFLEFIATAYFLAKKKDSVDDLLEFQRKRAMAAGPEDRQVEDLALFAIQILAGDRAEALPLLKGACERAPGEFWLFEEYALAAADRPADVKEAIRLLDSRPPTDPIALRKREQLSLQLANRVGDLDRARVAIDRLFDSRLSAEDQIQLLEQASKLGLDDRARLLSDRIRSSAGGNEKVLRTVLRQYESQKQKTEASETAFAILRAIPAPMAPNQNDARNEALRTLQQMGLLGPIIDRLTAKRKLATKSLPLVNELSECCRANGETLKSLELAGESISLGSNDASARMHLARLYEDSGRTREAIDQMLLAIAAQPHSFNNQTQQIVNVFAKGHETTILTSRMLECDPRVIDINSAVILFNSLWSISDQRDWAVKLLSHVWRPQVDSSSFSQLLLYNDSLSDHKWSHPGILALAKARLVTDSGSIEAEPWQGFGDVFQAMINVMAKKGLLSDFEAELRKHSDTRPKWIGGRAMLATLQLKLGRTKDARSILEAIWTENELRTMPAPARQVLFNAIKGEPSLAPLLYTELSRQLSAFARKPDETTIDASELRLYVDLARRRGDLTAATETIVKANRVAKPGSTMTSTFRFNNGRPIIQQIPVEGSQALFIAPLLELDRSWEALGNLFPQWLQHSQGNEAMRGQNNQALPIFDNFYFAVESLRADTVASFLDRVPDEELFELRTMPLLESDLRYRLYSRAISVVDCPVHSDAIAKIAARIAKRRQEKPDDLAAWIIAACFENERGQLEQLTGLAAWVKSHPLSELPKSGRPSAKVRREALDQVALWFAAMPALENPKTEAAGRILADRALQAARRLDKDENDRLYGRAILQEWIGIASRAKQTQRTQLLWMDLAEQLLPAKVSEERKAPLPANQFGRIISMVELAVRDKAIDAGMELIHRAVQGGLLAQPYQVQSGSKTMSLYPVQIFTNLVLLFREAGVPTPRILDCLMDVVLPKKRPGELWDVQHVHTGYYHSLFRLTADIASECDRLNVLNDRLRERLQFPNVSIEARTNVAELSKLRGDRASLREQLEWANQQSLRGSNEYLYFIKMAMQGIYDPEFEPLCRAILVKAASDFRQGSAGPIDDAYSLEIARSYLRSGEFNLARRYLKDYADPPDAAQGQPAAKRAKLAVAAGEWALVRRWSEAWELYGQYADLGGGELELDQAAAAVFARMQLDLASKPPIERYQFLKAWVLPKGLRPRYVASNFTTLLAPEGLKQPHMIGFTDSFAWLLDAAADAGQLEDLCAATADLAEKKVDRCRHLYLWVLLKAGRVEAAMKEYEQSAATREAFNKSLIGSCLNYQIARESLRRDETRRLVAPLMALIHSAVSVEGRSANSPLLKKLIEDLQEAILNVPPVQCEKVSGPLACWTTTIPGNRDWFVTDGHLIGRPGAASLRTLFPVMGEFELSFETTGPIQVNYGGYRINLQPVNHRASRSGAFAPLFHRVEIRLARGTLNFSLDGKAIHEVLPFHSNKPFLQITASPAGSTPDPSDEEPASDVAKKTRDSKPKDLEPIVLRNFKVTGSPFIPRQVELLTDKTLHWTDIEPPQKVNGARLHPLASLNPENESNYQHWVVKDGTLTGRRILSFTSAPTIQPYGSLSEGESIEYEYYFDPSASDVSACIGNLAFILSVEGVRWHWNSDYRAPGIELGAGKNDSHARGVSPWACQLTLEDQELELSPSRICRKDYKNIA